MSAVESIRSAVETLRESAGVESVFGEPFEIDGRTLVPVARVSYGFGGGFGRGPAESEGDGGAGATGEDEIPDDDASEDEASVGDEDGVSEDDENEVSEGGGAGGGVSARPVGVLEVSSAGTRFIRFEDRRRLAAAGVVGLLLGLLLARRSGGSR